MIIYKNDYVDITYQSTSRLIYFQWLKFVPSEKFQPIFEALGKNKVLGISDKWLIDCRAMRIISPEDQNWLLEEWLEAREDCAGRKIEIGMLMPEDLFGKLSVERLVKRMKGLYLDLAFKNFVQEAEAQEWASQKVKRLYPESNNVYI
ncbi:MAG: hypothetical protein AAFU64_09770 [Bacteroidota bacterium]